MKSEVIFLGTGSAFPSKSYNSCCLVRDGALSLLVDAGGGNGILRRLEEAGVPAKDIRHFFVTHVHTDHILGAVWVLRSAVQRMREGLDAAPLHFYGNSDVISALKTICRLTLHTADYGRMEAIVEFHDLDATPRLEIEGHRIEFFDVLAENVRQTGFRLRLDNGTVLAHLGDEALTERNAAMARGADTLICGAFCRYADREIFKPYEKHHSTVADVARIAAQSAIPRLILVHCEDRTLPDRASLYKAEAADIYAGRLEVPEDLEAIEL